MISRITKVLKLEFLLYPLLKSTALFSVLLNPKLHLQVILKSQKGEVSLRALKYVQMRISRGVKWLE